MSDATARIHTDGAARGNPGPAAWSYVIESSGRDPTEHAERLGEATNNVAEYTAFIRALERAAELGFRHVHVLSDSELMVKQINGQYAVKNADLRQLYDQATALLRRFHSARVEHVRREQNKRADALCNQVLDGRVATSDSAKPSAPKRKAKSRRRSDVDELAIQCLRSAAHSWGATKGVNPSPELVWDQIWSVLEENGVLKSTR